MSESIDPNELGECTLEELALVIAGAAELGRQAGPALTPDMISKYAATCLTALINRGGE